MTATQTLTPTTGAHDVSTTAAEGEQDETRTPCGDLLPDHLVDGHVSLCAACLDELARWDAAVA